MEWDRVPYTDKARYICVIRDPKDAFVSNYHFIRDVMLGPLMPAVAIWVRLFFSDATPFNWSEHLHGYWQNRHLPNLLILTFEEMKADLPMVVRHIAEVMRVELTDGEFDLVCQKSTFAYMKGINEKFAPPALSPWSSPNRQMIRKGQSGGSSELLSAELQRFIDTQCKADLQRLECAFPYGEAWEDLSVGAERAAAQA